MSWADGKNILMYQKSEAVDTVLKALLHLSYLSTLSPPPRKYTDLHVRKKFFGIVRTRYIDRLLLMSFLLTECISRKNSKSVHQGKWVNIRAGLKLQKFAFYKSCSLYKGNDTKLTRA
jgi:hypothetical protein